MVIVRYIAVKKRRPAFLSGWFSTFNRNRGRLVLIDGMQLIVLKWNTLEGVSPMERAGIVHWRSCGKTVFVVRNNDLARKAVTLIQQEDARAAYYRKYPELTTSFKRSDKSTFVSGI